MYEQQLSSTGTGPSAVKLLYFFDTAVITQALRASLQINPLVVHIQMRHPGSKKDSKAWSALQLPSRHEHYDVITQALFDAVPLLQRTPDFLLLCNYDALLWIRYNEFESERWEPGEYCAFKHHVRL